MERNKETTSTYRNIFKATSLFGGVQIWKILIGIIKQKAIALLIGPTGMGISGLYTSATQMVQGFTSMGLSQSAVKNIAEANGTHNEERVGRVVAAFRKLVWVTGFLGMAAVIILSPMFSKSSFGDYEHIIPFILISSTLLFQQLIAGQTVVMQGMRSIKNLAIANVLGALASLLITIPLYYFFRIDGIIPAIILYEIATLTITSVYSRRVKISKVDISIKDAFLEGKGMLGMGLTMTVDASLGFAIAYVVRVFISNIGGTDAVGLYVAGLTLVNTYVSMVFSAMTTDFYPRLSGVNKDNKQCGILINQQAEVAVLIIVPIAAIFIVASPLIVKLLYSEDFLAIVPFIQFAMAAMALKAASWAVAHVYLAKAELKIFLVNEATTKIANLVLCILFYKWWGMLGLGVAYFCYYLVYFFVVYLVAVKKYRITYSKKFSIFLLLSTTSLIFLIIASLNRGAYFCVFEILLLCALVFLPLYYLNEKLSFSKFVSSVLKNNR